MNESQRNDLDERLAYALATTPGPRHARPITTEEAHAAPVLIDGYREVPESEDTAKAFDELEGWLLRGGGQRACWCIERLAGKYKVGLSVVPADLLPAERFTAGQDRTLRGAIRNALMIAKLAGYK